MFSRRNALLALVPVAGFLVVGAATPTLTITTFSVSASTGVETSGKIKGTASFKISGDKNARTLIAYGNGTGAGVYQCVELIGRYGLALGLASFPKGKLPALGNGYQVAQKFATLSGGGFAFISNGATDLPKPGAVISIEDWKGSDGKWIGGHVGIVANYTAPTSKATTLTFSIFEQNMPTPTWKTITFTKSGTKWSGYMLNNSIKRSVVGWANPK